MKYMLLTYLNEKTWLEMTPEQQKREMDSCAPHVQKQVGQLFLHVDRVHDAPGVLRGLLGQPHRGRADRNQQGKSNAQQNWLDRKAGNRRECHLPYKRLEVFAIGILFASVGIA